MKNNKMKMDSSTSRPLLQQIYRHQPVRSRSLKSHHAAVGRNAAGYPLTQQLQQSQADMLITERRANNVLTCLSRFGMAVIDNFLGESIGLNVRNQCESLKLSDGKTTSHSVPHIFRQDKIAWVHGSEPNCSEIGRLLSALDKLISRVDHRLSEYNISGRTPAMAACYPGGASHYVRHVDNPRKDGRVITCIYYLNPNWNSDKDGGVLRVYPTLARSAESGGFRMACVEPILNRLVIFWSDRRTPHEVLPTHAHRYAVTVWYFDKHERELALNRIRKTPIRLTSEVLLTKTSGTTIKTAGREKNNLSTRAEDSEEIINVVDLDCTPQLIGQSPVSPQPISQSRVSFNEDASPSLDEGKDE